MRPIESKHYPIKTNHGVFYLKLTAEFDRNTEALQSYVINIGSRKNKCVQLNIPAPNTNKKTGLLMNVESDESCSLETFVKERLAQHMTLIGLTVARQLNPGLVGVELYDASTFDCKMPDGETKRTSMKQFYFAFHGSTWYEEFFGARMYSNHENYLAQKQRILHDPSSKPPKFNFTIYDLNEILDPLYDSTNTWAEFFAAIEAKYGPKKCTVLYPWLHTVPGIYILETPSWYIDFTDSSINDKLPMIQFRRNTTRNIVNGGTRKGKRRVSKLYTYLLNPSRLTIYEYDYKSFLNAK